MLGEPFEEKWVSTLGVKLDRTKTIASYQGSAWERDSLQAQSFGELLYTATFLDEEDFINFPESVPDTVPSVEYDHVQLLKTNANLTRTSLSFNIWDYGGQDVFYTLHHIFLTKYGAYCVVFNSVKLYESSEKHVKFLEFWLNSIRLHAGEAIVLLVGTHYDKLKQYEDGKTINQKLVEVDFLLKKMFECNVNLKTLKVVREEHRSSGEIFHFFPIDNRNGEGVGELKCSIEKAVENEPYVNQKVSVRWVRILDELIAGARQYWYLDSTIEKAAVYKVEREECLEMLSFFHELGVIVHFERFDSRVITNPQWLLDMFTYVIHDKSVHRNTVQAKKRLNDMRESGSSHLFNDYEALLSNGVASCNLLKWCWGRAQRLYSRTDEDNATVN